MQAVNIVGAQYHSIFETPPPIPTTEEWFEHQAKRYLDANLGVQADVDRFYDILLPVIILSVSSGAVLCVFREFRNEELDELMTQVVVNKKRGKNYLNLAHLTNEPWVPKGAHLLTDVRDGRDRCNITPSVNHANIAKEGRKGFAAIHIVLWGLYHGQDTLTHHFLDGVASEYKSERVLNLCLDGDGPKLDASWIGNPYPKWGAPCAGSVLVPQS